MEMLKELLGIEKWVGIVRPAVEVLAVLLIMYVLILLIKRAMKRLKARLAREDEDGGATESGKRAETLTRLLRQTAIVIVLAVGGLVILGQFGISLAPLLASAGIVGLAVGFGAQSLVRDFFSGFFIILENQIRVGDVAVINGTGGLVEQINLRITVLRDLEGRVHTFPNGTITTMTNLTNEWSAWVTEIGVAYKEDVDRVMGLMREVGGEMRGDEKFSKLMIEDIEVFGLDRFADSALVIKGRLKTRPMKQWEVGREFNRRLKKRFDDEGIEIPFPHHSIYFGEASKPIEISLSTKHP